MNIYTYTDVFKKEILLVCKSSSIIKADKIFEEETSINPSKSSVVTVSILPEVLCHITLV